MDELVNTLFTQDIFFSKAPGFGPLDTLSKLLNPWLKKWGPLCFFPTSGSTLGRPRWVMNAQSHFIAQTQEGLRILGIPKGGRWGLMLPKYHVGGFSLMLRAQLSQGELLHWSSSWDPQATYRWLVQEKIEYISVVPTQLYDWLSLDYEAPLHLRLVLLGGASLSPQYLDKARVLGWPVKPVYGMTETNAFFSIWSHENQAYETIPSYQFQVHAQGELFLKSQYLALAYLDESGELTPLREDPESWWLSPDKVQAKGGGFLLLGRRDTDFFKRNGRAYFLSAVEQALIQHLEAFSIRLAWGQEAMLVLCPCPRSGHRLVLVLAQDRECLQQALALWNQSQAHLPLEVKFLDPKEWPRTATLKVDLKGLQSLVCAGQS